MTSVATPARLGCRYSPRLLIVLVLAAGVSLFASGTTFAAVTHPLISSFDGTGSTPGAFAGVDRLAIRQSSGDVFALDAGHEALDRFDGSGTAQSFADPALSGATDLSIGPLGTDPDVAVDNSGTASEGDIYVSSEEQGLVYGFTPTGAPLPNFPISVSGDICGVGVDPSGNVWVSDFGSGIHEYDSAGTPLTGLFNGSGYCHFAFDSSGHLYAAQWNSRVEKYDPDGSGGFRPDVHQILDTGSAKSVTVDPVTGNVFVAHPTSVNEYDSAGVELSIFGFGTLSNAVGVAVDAATGHVYVSDAGSDVVDVFATALTPDVTTSPATSVSEDGATFNGTVTPDGIQVSDCHFEYGSDTSYGQTVPCAESVGSATGPVPVHADVSGLSDNALYHFRLVASNANGASHGNDLFAATGIFGITPESFVAGSLLADGSGALGTGASPDTQAGGHPFQASSNFAVNVTPVPEGTVPAGGATKDAVVQLPPGFLGNPLATPRCRPSTLDQQGFCPNDTAIGVVHLNLYLPPAAGQGPDQSYFSPVYNMIPSYGEPALFAFYVPGKEPSLPVYIHLHLDSARNYAATASITDISALGMLERSELTLWGVPADASHDRWRGFFGQLAGGREGPGCLVAQLGGGSSEGQCPSDAQPRPLLTDPTACDGAPLLTALAVDAWGSPGPVTAAGDPLLSDPAWHAASALSPAPTGCDQLKFGGAEAPVSLAMQPTVHTAGSPSGYEVKLALPYDDNAEDLANPTLRDIKVQLPTGTVINPSAADGLGACSPGQIGLVTAVGATPIRFNSQSAACPDSSKLGTVEVHSPLVDHPLQGTVYLAQQTQNPFGSLLAIYVVLDDPETGIIVKLAGHVETDPNSGAISATFTENPQLPFTELKLDLSGGPRAPLANPQSCGTFTTQTDLTPWSAPATPDATSSDGFQINEGCGAGGSFAPSFSAGTTNPQAGAFSSFTTTFSRSDQDQDLGGIQLKLPAGLLGAISNVPLCGEPQAAQGTCSPASEIGHAIVGAGLGPDPIYLPVSGQPANPVYLTGPYKGAPFGLSVVVPAVAGPFNLGTVVVRAAINVDPHTAQITVASDPLPTILQGIPLQIRTVNVTVDRPDFTFNPTSCDSTAVSATISSTQGTTAAATSPFQAANCATLPFKPSLTASTRGNGLSKGNGASLLVKVASKSGPGIKSGEEEANIKKVDVMLPTAFSSRLTTLQKACTEAQFAANPAGCPEGSNVGMAIAHTPTLPVPLQGPAYLVSHGGAAFPDLVLVLQGDGVSIDLVGNTQIKKDNTFSRFESIPDAPISSFELTLPEGPHSALAANKSLCTPTKTVTVSQKATRRVHGRVKHVTVKVKKSVPEALVMPTTITAQNGAVIQQATKVAVSGCKAKPTKPKVKKGRRAGKPRHTRTGAAR